MTYDGPLVDAHHHFWDLALGRHPWLTPEPGREMVFGDPSPLYRNYLPADLRRDAARQRLAGSVHVEAGWDRTDPVGETRWLEGLARATALPTGIVAFAPLDDPAVGDVLEGHLRASPRVRGVRFILSWHVEPEKSFVLRSDYMTDVRWREGFARLAPLGLSFDLMLYPGQMADAARLAAAFPETLILVNHAGSPVDRDPEGMAAWQRGLRLLAEQPNVRLKISDLVAYDHDWTVESLRAVTLACIDAFGPGRCLFGSDFPVAGLHATFDQVFDGFRAFVADFTPEEQRALFHDNAVRDYRLPISTAASAKANVEDGAAGQEPGGRDQGGCSWRGTRCVVRWLGSPPAWRPSHSSSGAGRRPRRPGWPSASRATGSRPTRWAGPTSTPSRPG
jgi:predicted TIM-barrel fold metal-dependent hydrolase